MSLLRGALFVVLFTTHLFSSGTCRGQLYEPERPEKSETAKPSDPETVLRIDILKVLLVLYPYENPLLRTPRDLLFDLSMGVFPVYLKDFRGPITFGFLVQSGPTV